MNLRIVKFLSLPLMRYIRRHLRVSPFQSFKLIGLVSFVLLLSVMGGGSASGARESFAIAIPQEPETLDPHYIRSKAEQGISSLISESLVVSTIPEPAPDHDYYGLEPWLAEGWEISDDGLTYKFWIRKGVIFHDGEPLNAEAVRYNLDRLRTCETPNSYLLESIESIDLIDDYTVQLNLKYPFPPLLDYLSLPQTGMVSLRQLRELPDLCDQISDPVGTGAFKFMNWVRGSYIQLEANEYYWRGWDSPPPVKRISLRFVSEDDVREILIKAGEIDVIGTFSPDTVERLRASPNLNVHIIPTPSLVSIGMNTKKDHFNKLKVRQALNFCMDKGKIIDLVYRGTLAAIAQAPIAERMFAWRYIQHRDFGFVGAYPYDVKRGKNLLKEAGEGDGFKAELIYPEMKFYREIALLTQAMLKDCDIDVKVVGLPPSEWMRKILQPAGTATHEMFLFPWSAISTDPYETLNSRFSSGGFWNRTFYENEVVDDRLKKVVTTPDQASRRAMYQQAMQEIWSDAPYLWLVEERGAVISIKGLNEQAQNKKAEQWLVCVAAKASVGIGFQAGVQVSVCKQF
jgi:peptide/nickel transport system substrate-binding protein